MSAPGEPTRSATRKNINEKLRDIAGVSDLRVPELKVGTLDALVQLSEDLAKIDSFGESIAHKVSQFQADLLNQDKEKLAEIMNVYGRSLETYISKFEWDTQKYNVGGFVRDISGEIGQRLSAIESEMKSKMQAYNKVKGNLSALERKTNGSLLIRSLNELVKPDHFVLNSEYLITLLVVVPNNLFGDWNASYPTLTDLVVPNSSEFVVSDNDYGLFTVTVFRKIAQDFKTVAREKKFIVRDFEFLPEDVQSQKAEATSLQSDLAKKLNASLAWCKTAFSESFSAWIHVKILRVFVESVLRYGLPMNFETVVVQPRKNLKSGRRALQQLYAHLDGSAGGRDTGMVDVAGIGIGADYFPYVTFTVDLGHFSF